ncbi:hypothetical protein [Mesorhizobium sp. A556]
MSVPIKGYAAVMVAAALLYGMQRTTPLYSEITSPVPIAGRQGERIDTTAFAIGITNTHLARKLTVTDFGSTRTYITSGVWVIVEGAAEAKHESLALTSAEWLGPGGLRYQVSQRLPTIPGSLGTEQLEPGIPRPILMAFEVPETQLAGARLLVSRSAMTPLDEQASIELTDLRPDAILPSIKLGRGNPVRPWTLEAK